MTTQPFTIYLSRFNVNDNFNTSEYTIEDLTVPCSSVDVQYASGAPQSPIGCASTKYSGDSINLSASPNGAVGPYYVRFWRKSSPGTYSEIGSVRTVTEGSSTSTSILLGDSDLVAATGDSTAGQPSTDSTGIITDPENSTATFGAGVIRVATTIYDSCPIGAQSCTSYCDVSLGCIAPTCNFTVL